MDMQGCTVTGRAEDRDCSAECLDAGLEADDAGAAAGVGAPDAVVAYQEGEGAVAAVYPHGDDRRLRVLCGVGQRLGRDVIAGHLEMLRGRRAEFEVQVDRHRGAPGERLERRAASRDSSP